ncbi:hypothetical protein [Vibrio nigripulchritudo]|uniref:hypothetical protein n=1 Tax=Vibrio nigripulchritudo TaxID=28173 RepID=UPI002491C76B|nr:hypothetical protein [Vibrio nigripulchritudo]BDU41189.1 hypothetical protein TUMSATVNIG2_56580 [Vibrio nigripulchritudo]BDU46954.1 hypothetical protein TUMSATVNIG3_57520 [Vibrio nigripulchritudo]
MKIKLTKEDLDLINRSLTRHRWHVEKNTDEGTKHPDFQHTAFLMDKLAVPCNESAELEIR